MVRLKKRNLPFALPEKQVRAMPFMVTQASSVMMSSPSPTSAWKPPINWRCSISWVIKSNWTEL